MDVEEESGVDAEYTASVLVVAGKLDASQSRKDAQAVSPKDKSLEEASQVKLLLLYDRICIITSHFNGVINL